MSANPKISVIRDNSNPNQSVDYEIYAKGLETPRQIALSGDVGGNATGDLSQNLTITTTIGDGKVTTAKIDNSAVTTDKINDKAVTIDKIADAAKGGAVSDNDGNLATHSAVKTYVDSVVAGEGKYKGVQTVATINQWTVSNLNNGDRVITEDAGTISFNGQSLPVDAGQELVLWKDTSTNPITAVWQTSEGNYKLKQTAKSDPTASGTTITAIATITQDENGDITATKSTIRGATTSQTGVVQLAGSIGATVASENNKAASEKSVRDAIDDLDANITSIDGTNVQVNVVETNGKITGVSVSTDNTVAKVTSATAGHIATFTSGGGISDSGTSVSDLATSAQGSKADSAVQGIKLDGQTNPLTKDANKVVTIPNAVATGTGETNGLMTAADKAKLDAVAAGATKVESSTTNGHIKINGTDTAVYTHPSQTAYTSKGSATKVPQITTDSTGHVTGITEVTITGVTPAAHAHGNISDTGTLTDTAAAAAGNDYVVIRDATNNQIQTSTIKGTDVADAVSKKHSHSDITLTTSAQTYDGTHTIALPASDPYTSARTPASHDHGNISNSGTLTDTAAAAAGDDYVVIRDETNNKIQTSTIKGTDVADAVSKKHSHSDITLTTSAQTYDGTHTIALPALDPYTSARTPASHTHGNISNSGTLTDTAAAATGNDYVVIRDADNNKVQTSTIKGTDVADAITKKHEHSSLTLSKSAQVYDGTHTLALPSTDPYTSSRTPTSHTHGNITNDGKLQTTDVAVANGDKLVITDASDSGVVARTSITFDGTTTNKALTPKGTWEEFSGASPSDSTPLMDGTAAAGSSMAFARGDHVHPTDTSREPVFTMNYDASDNALVISKAIGTVTSGN